METTKMTTENTDKDSHCETALIVTTVAYEQGVSKGRQAFQSGKEIENPYAPSMGCDFAWKLGYDKGMKQAARMKATKEREEREKEDGFKHFGIMA